MRSLLVDDEPDARTRLRRLLAAHPDVVIADEAQDGLEALEKIEALRPDLLFLDIETPGLGGFEVLQSIPQTVPLPLVIFVTGYDQYALAAFESNALAYLLKPVEPDRLAQALDRARRLSAFSDEREQEQKTILQVARQSPRALRYIVCRKRNRFLLLPPEEILWFEAQDGVVTAKTATDSFWVNYQLAELEAALPDEMFFRARRESLVNITRIKEIKPSFKSGFLLVMADAASTEILVSERRVHPLRLRLPGL